MKTGFINKIQVVIINSAYLLVGDYKLLGSFWTDPHWICSKFQNLGELVLSR